ncbi:helix-turn-helix domain-containing protein [Ideonella sp. DXS29W]|uniref:Helix-turn-helix domain-containing protein n=1 Tax=Ideonella lacteola TaxID=2984193 RepID=A0ABU9BKH4_9BURK
MSCPVARSLEQIGDWWTLLVIREAFYGTRRFKDFEAHLGIAPNILSGRLAKLVEHGILNITESTPAGKALAYRLSEKGRDLFPIIVALAQWGGKHAPAPKGPPIRIVERATEQEIAPLALLSADGRMLSPREVTVVEGPGASRADRQRLQLARAQRVAAQAVAAPQARPDAAADGPAPARVRGRRTPPAGQPDDAVVAATPARRRTARAPR